MNISQQDAYEATQKAIEANWVDLKHKSKLTIHSLTQMIKLILTLNVFEFDGIFFQQIFQVSMGSKCSPEIADITMYEVECKIIHKGGSNLHKLAKVHR